VLFLTIGSALQPVYHFEAMEAFDPAGEWRHLSEHYRQMSDNELMVLARQKAELTDVAHKLWRRRFHTAS